MSWGGFLPANTEVSEEKAGPERGVGGRIRVSLGGEGSTTTGDTDGHMRARAVGEQLIWRRAPEEAAFLRRLRDGDEGAFSQLWDRFGPRLLGYAATRLGGDEGLAEDIVAQSLAAAVRSIRSFDPNRSNLSAWVFGVARRVIQGEMRRQGRRASVPAQAEVPLAEDLDQHVVSHLDLPSRLEAQRKVRVLAAALSEAEMEVLVLHFVDEFTVKEIAQITGRSWRAINSLLYRAKQKARERLAQDGD